MIEREEHSSAPKFELYLENVEDVGAAQNLIDEFGLKGDRVVGSCSIDLVGYHWEFTDEDLIIQFLKELRHLEPEADITMYIKNESSYTA